MLKLTTKFYAACKYYKRAYWRPVESDVWLIEHDVFKTIVVHRVFPEGVHGQECSTEHFVATESRTGMAIAVGVTLDEAEKNAINILEGKGVRDFEKQVAKRIRLLPSPTPNVIATVS